MTSTPTLPARRSLDLRNHEWIREIVLFGLLLAIIIGFSIAAPGFFSLSNLIGTSRYFVEVGLISLGMTLVIMTRGIDLSVGSLLGLCSIVLGFSYQAGVPMPLAIALALVAGLLGGLLNGWLITSLGLDALVVTIGTLALFRGLALGISSANAVSDFPDWFAYIGQYFIGGLVPGQLVLFVVVAAIVAVVMSLTRFGHYIKALGLNPGTARLSGVPVKRIALAAYAVTGVLVGLAAIVYTSRVSTAQSNSGVGLELEVIAAVLLGGTSIRGGRGTVVGTVLGIVLIAVLRNGLQLSGVDSAWRMIVLGLVIVAAVAVNERLGANKRP